MTSNDDGYNYCHDNNAYNNVAKLCSPARARPGNFGLSVSRRFGAVPIH